MVTLFGSGFRRVVGPFFLAGILGLTSPGALQARRSEPPVFAESADDVALRVRLAGLGPSVDPAEARRVAEVAYNTGRELRIEWQVVWPPGYQNYLVNHGLRKAGLCFQWATELLVRLDALQLRTLELHWAESFQNTLSEHNVIVVTARGQPFAQGILLDNWRYGGHLVWGPVSGDPHYRWTENPGELERRRPRPRLVRHDSRPEQSGKGAAITPEQKKREDRDERGHAQPGPIEKNVEEHDVHHQGTEQGQTERNKTPDDQD